MDKIKEVAKSIRRDHSESLIRFDETLDSRTVIHRTICNDDLGTIAHIDPPLIARVFGDGLELKCLMWVHTFQRYVAIPKLCDLRESVRLFLWSGARPGGLLEEYVEIMSRLLNS
jgi:hypothetical protein